METQSRKPSHAQMELPEEIVAEVNRIVRETGATPDRVYEAAVLFAMRGIPPNATASGMSLDGFFPGHFAGSYDLLGRLYKAAARSEAATLKARALIEMLGHLPAFRYPTPDPKSNA